MLLYLLKSSACLAIFLIFYKLLLEKETIHNFKRFFLLLALLVSFIIPAITFIEYIEPTTIIDTFVPTFEVTQNTQNIPIEEDINYLPILLWSLYGLGVLIFGLKFSINLFRITKRIQRNPKYKNRTYTNVLLLDLITPHTFFNFIFLNKDKFETQQIPEEVLLHEEAHAKQKHSLDIIFIELLQVIFWFNPLFYLSKKAIKLNHEFLADRAVLKHGIKPSLYQQLLLAFSSNATEPTLANAINYSLIKKRFTIMKSQTSKKAIWLRSLLLLPLLGGLLFSFSSTQQIEKEMDSVFSNPDSSNELIITLKPDGQFSHNNTIVSIKDIKALITSKTNTISIIPDGVIEESIRTKAILSIGKLGVKGLNYGSTNAEHAEYIKQKKHLKNDTYKEIITPSPYERVKESFTDAINDNVVLEVKQEPLRLKLNGKTTSLETLTEDYKTIVGEPSDLRIYVKGGIKMTLINAIRSKLKDYVNKINLSQGGHIIGDTDDNNTELITRKDEKTIPVVNGIKCDGCTLFLSKTGVEKLILSTTTREPITKFWIKFPGKRSVIVKGNTANNNKEIETNVKNAKIGDVVQLFEIKTKDETLKPVIIKLVDRNNPKYSKSPQVVKADNAEPSDLPPPPPPPAPIYVKKGHRTLNEVIESTPKGLKTGYKTINGESHYFITYKNGVTVYYNKFGVAVNKNGKELPPPPPPKPVNVKEPKHAPKKIAETKINTESIEAINKRNLRKQILEDRKIAMLDNKKEAINKRQIELDKKINLRKQLLKKRKTAKKEALNKRRAELEEKRNRPKEMAEAEIKTGYLDINGKKHYYTTVDGKTRYFNRYGVETDKKGKELTPNKQVSSDQVLPNSNISKVYFDDKVVSEFKTSNQALAEAIPETPSMLGLKNKGAIFYYEGEKITGKKAIDLVDNNRDLNILIRSINAKQPIVKLSTAPIRL